MLYIEKKPCPADIQAEIDHLTRTKAWQSFSEHPVADEAKRIRTNYFNKLDKSRVREALIAEQKGICAYCMCAIENNGRSTTIEHLVPLSKSKAGAMSYANWLAVCNGGRNTPLSGGEKRVICCDAKKSNTSVTLTPLDRDRMERIAYYDDGSIYYRDPSDPQYTQIRRDLNEVYGLNGTVDARGRSRKDTTTGIVKRRKDTYITLFEELMEMEAQGLLTIDLVRRFRRSLCEDEAWEPFVGVKLYVLDLFLETLSE